MDQILSLIRQFIDLFRFWIIVCPWEQAVRVRLGKRLTVLHRGIHLRIPLLDHIFLQSTRMRVTSTDRQTITTLDGKTVTVTASVGYSIADVHKLYDTLHHAEDTIRNVVRANIAKTISERASTGDRGGSHAGLSLSELSKEIARGLNLEEFGLAGVTIYINEFAVSRTFRIIGDSAQSYSTGNYLSTEKQNTSP